MVTDAIYDEHQLGLEDHADALSLRRQVYPILAEHQKTEDWQFKEIAQQAQEWAEKLIVEFNLDVGPISLCIGTLSRNTLGHFRPKHNGFGLLGEIAINSDHLKQLPQLSDSESPEAEFELHWDAIGTLFHELLHAQQTRAGTSSLGNHHNRGFQLMAAEFGLVVDRYGITTYDPNGRFIALLKNHNVRVPANLADFTRVPTHRAKPKGTGKSKLKKWSCTGCEKPQNAWLGAAEVELICKRCKTELVRTNCDEEKGTAPPSVQEGSTSEARSTIEPRTDSTKVIAAKN